MAGSVGEGYRCRWRMCCLFGRRGRNVEMWRPCLELFLGRVLEFPWFGNYEAKGGCQWQGKGTYEGYSRYEHVYARSTLWARLRFSGAIHFDRSLLLMLEIRRAMKQ